jgi:hypothetical protein
MMLQVFLFRCYCQYVCSFRDTLTVTFSLAIPKWAFVGAGKIYVNVFACDYLVYCPEKSKDIIVVA